MRKLLKNKKGELTDYLIFLITIFILAIGFFVMIYVIPEIGNGLKNAGMNSTSEGSDAIESMISIGTGTINMGFMLLFVGLIISMMITSFMVRTHPIFLFLYILFLGITLLLGLYLGNAYYTFEQNPLFASTIANAGFIHLVMSNIVLITLAVSALSMIIIFAKFSTFGGTQQF